MISIDFKIERIAQLKLKMSEELEQPIITWIILNRSNTIRTSYFLLSVLPPMLLVPVSSKMKKFALTFRSIGIAISGLS